ncbi:MAG: queuosine precursor transporter [Gammaproteobacteria bacterium]
MSNFHNFHHLFLGDVIAEVYGYQQAKKLVKNGIICLLIFSNIGFFIEKLPSPHEYRNYSQAYSTIFTLLFRSSFSNSIAMLIGAVCNIYCISKWKILIRGRHFWLRSLGSSAIGEFFYTLFVVSLVNIGIVSFKSFLEILSISYCFKLLFGLLAVFPANLLVMFLKTKEEIDMNNLPEKYTPFGSLDKDVSCH